MVNQEVDDGERRHSQGDLLAKLKARQVSVRLSAVRELASLSPEVAVDKLIEMLADRSNHVIAEAARGLETMKAAEAIGPLIQAYERLSENGLARDPGCVARWQIVTTLAALVTEHSVHPHVQLRKGHQFGSPADVFFHAIRTEQVEKSGIGLEDMAVGLRGQAALSLAQIGADGALLAISLLLFDMDAPPEVPVLPQDEPYVTLMARRSAARALAVLGDPGGVSPLGIKLTYHQHEVPELLVECMDAIASLDPKAALDLIPKFLSSGDYGSSASSLYLTAGAATALASLPEPYHRRVLNLLIDTCRNSFEPDVRESVALSIASIRSDLSMEGLQVLAKDESVDVRLAAVKALEVRRGKPSYDLLIHMVENDEDPGVVAAAKKAIQLSPQ